VRPRGWAGDLREEMEFTSSGPAALDCIGITKRFGPTTVLDSVSFSVRPGTIHALVGENGAGKSTFLGIVSGRIGASAGEVSSYGTVLRQGRTRESHRVGIRTIYQELMAVPALSAEANVFLGSPFARYGWLRRRAMRSEYLALCERIGVAAYPGRRVRDLSVADRQMLEIIRALAADARVILYDEPTAALAEHERDALFTMMRGQRDQGMTQVLVSHNLDEVMELCDAITVLRNGKVEADFTRREFDKDTLVTAILGASLARATPSAKPLSPTGLPALRLRNVRIPDRLHGIDLDVYPGEIVAVAGLVGSGRSSLLRAVAGLEPAATGTIELGGRAHPWPHTPRRANAIKVALIPEDRKEQGLVMTMTAAENIALPDFGAVARLGFVRKRRLRQVVRDYGTRVAFDPRRADTPAGALSGGNQQKLLLARWLHNAPKVLLADEPIRGVDVGAKEEILRTLRDLAATGTAVVVVSSELDAVLPVCHRVFVIAEGCLVATLDNQPAVLTAAEVLSAVFDGDQGPA
jgi:rhamnose transport system ATP-binding protein